MGDLSFSCAQNSLESCVSNPNVWMWRIGANLTVLESDADDAKKLSDQIFTGLGLAAANKKVSTLQALCKERLSQWNGEFDDGC